MKKIILILTLLVTVFSTQVFSAVPWNSLEAQNQYTLDLGFEIPTQNGALELSQGEPLFINEIVALGFINVTLVRTKILNCDDGSDFSDMNIIDVTTNSSVVAVGVLLEENCNLEFFIENTDILKESIFKRE